MKVFADLHMHSHYSRATSSMMNVKERSKFAKLKGINLLGTGDFTHPKWLQEMKATLDYENDIYTHDGMNFILSSEISLIYSQNGRGRKVHHIILAPSFDVVDQINEWLDTKGRRDYDGRPIFGFSSIEFVEKMMSISKDIEVIPAHIWTPWFSVLGSMGGFNSMKECFADQLNHIHAVETGLSSDPPMNWRVSELDRFTLVSNSDSHSPYAWRMGREANVFDLKDVNYAGVVKSIRTRNNFLFTIEVDPAYGKYHVDGHRNCDIMMLPADTKKSEGICPKCRKPMTIGVLNRVEQLADRQDGYKPKNAVPFMSLLPLAELTACALGCRLESKKNMELYNRLISKLGNEFHILIDAGQDEILKVADQSMVDIIIKNRQGKLRISPGYDGVYGKIIDEGEKITYHSVSVKSQKSLSDPLFSHQ